MKINKLKLLALIFVIIAIVTSIIYFVYAGNQDKSKENIEVKYEKITTFSNFRLGISNFDSINPHMTQNRDVIQASQLIFEPLLDITHDYKISNCLASEWSKVSDKVYVIKLKDNITWHDGSKFSAEDVKFTIEKIQKDKKSIYLENVKQIKNTHVLDSNTIRIELNESVAFFEYQLIFPIISKKQYENASIQDSKIIPTGTGKYKIAKIENDSIELKKNDKWHNIEKINLSLETITISIFETMGEVYSNFKLGNIDLVNTTNVNYEEYIGSMGYQKKQYQGREFDYIAFNNENVVLQDVAVRQAISKTINKSKIISSVLENRAYISDFPLDCDNYLVDKIDFSTVTNQEEARKILNDNGWKYEYGIWSKEIDNITRTLNFNLSVNKENKQRVKVAKEIKKQLEDFGIKLTIIELENSDYKKVLENRNYEIILTGVYNSYSPDLYSFFGDENLANYKNDEINKLLKNALNSDSEEIRKECYKEIIEIYKQDVPYIGLYKNQVTLALGQSVRGDVSPNNYSVFYGIEKWYRQ